MGRLPKSKPLPHQAGFIHSFIAREDARTLLVAAPGTGRTVTTVALAERMLKEGLVDRVLLVAGNRAIAEQWRTTSEFARVSVDRDAPATTRVTTYTALRRDPDRIWESSPIGTRWLFVFAEVEFAADHLEETAADALVRFPGSRALFVANSVPSIEVDARFEFNLEFFSHDALQEPITQSNLIRLAPSLGLLEKIQHKLIELDDLSWREFEHLVARMLETGGYTVELMRGSKDGGVDVIATKELDGLGTFKSVWQAKKHRRDRKVGLSMVRELADVQSDLRASKAMIVTTSYLTSGALERVERDRYRLGKVDRTDLNRWIERTLRNG